MAWHNASATIERYLNIVQEQIRWKRARPVLALELERHLEDQRDAFIQEGHPPEEAERLAVEDMGDPVEVGAELDRVHRPRPQWGLLGLTLALGLACTILRLVLTAGWCSVAVEFPKGLLAFLLGTGALMGAYFLDISRLARYARAVYLAVVALGAGTILYAEITKNYQIFYRYSVLRYLPLFFPVVYALWVYACRGRGWPGLLFAIAGGIPLTVVCAEWYPNVANLAVLLFSGFGIVLFAAWGDWFGAGRGGSTAAVLGVTAALAGLVCLRWPFNAGFLHRLSASIHPEQDPMGLGWIVLRIRELLTDVPMLRGPGEDIYAHVQYPSLPSPPGFGVLLGRDFLPALLAATFGWLAFLALELAAAALVVWLLAKGLRQKHRLGRLIVLAVSLSLGLRVLLSTQSNLGMLVFSVGYPFLGGNSFLVVDMALAGLALSVFRGDAIARDETVPSPRRRIKRIRLHIEYQ